MGVGLGVGIGLGVGVAVGAGVTVEVGTTGVEGEGSSSHARNKMPHRAESRKEHASRRMVRIIREPCSCNNSPTMLLDSSEDNGPLR